MSSGVAVERRGDVVWCALDRPPLNLFEPGLIAALRTTFETLARDASIRAAVLTGRGRAFTAGMDVRVLHGLDARSARALISDLCAAIDAVHRAPFPVLAAVRVWAPASSSRSPATCAWPPPTRRSACPRYASACRR